VQAAVYNLFQPAAIGPGMRESHVPEIYLAVFCEIDERLCSLDQVERQRVIAHPNTV